MNKTKQNPVRKGKKIVRTMLIAAVITVMLCTGVVATELYVTGPDEAWEVAQSEVTVMKEMGILSADVNMSAAPERVYLTEGSKGGEYWFNRIFKPSYVVGSSTSDYFMNMDVDTASGKITRLHIEAYAGANDAPVGTAEEAGQSWNLYDNYDDIFPVDMTVDEFCSKLAAYWGFGGYTVAGTHDSIYGYSADTSYGSLKMTDIPEEVYLTVFFDGDQSGAPMYISKAQFPNRVSMVIGTSHPVG